MSYWAAKGAADEREAQRRREQASERRAKAAEHKAGVQAQRKRIIEQRDRFAEALLEHGCSCDGFGDNRHFSDCIILEVKEVLAERKP